MDAAGLAWAVYTLRGRKSARPLADTAGNFARSLPLAALAIVVALAWPGARLHATPRGIAYAIASGALASGAGYAIWYAALRKLTATRAALVQLAVPVLAAAGGVLLLGERLTVTLAASATAILAGIALSVLGRRA
jgi:drug/metabolite transporter (DMT)-like permease